MGRLLNVKSWEMTLFSPHQVWPGMLPDCFVGAKVKVSSRCLDLPRSAA